MQRKYVEASYFKVIDSVEKAYWLGYLCADGSIGKSAKRIKTVNRLSLTSKDREVIYKFKKAVKSDHFISTIDVVDKRTGNRSITYHISINNRELITNLERLGVSKNKTDLLTFPRIKKCYYSYFIAGLFDGDGSMTISGNNLKINLISTKEVLQKIQEHFYKLTGFRPQPYYKVSENKSNVYKIYLYKGALYFLKFTYQKISSELYLQRKYLKFKEIEQTLSNIPPRIYPIGKKHSEETRRKISIANTGRIFSLDHLRHMSEANKGKKLSAQTKKLISLSNKGRTTSKEVRIKLSLAAKKRKRSSNGSFSNSN